MSLSATFYKISDDPKNITKTLIDTGTGANNLATFNVDFKQGNDILRPTITVRSASTQRVMDRCNYVKIALVPTGSQRNTKYYYVTNIKVSPTSIYTFTLQEDVLMVYNEQLKALTVTLDRSETIYNGYLPDSDYTALGYRSITCRAFDKGLTTNSFILMTTG